MAVLGAEETAPRTVGKHCAHSSCSNSDMMVVLQKKETTVKMRQIGDDI